MYGSKIEVLNTFPLIFKTSTSFAMFAWLSDVDHSRSIAWGRIKRPALMLTSSTCRRREGHRPH